MSSEHDELKPIPTGAYLTYISSFEGVMEKDNLTLEEAKDAMVQDCIDVGGGRTYTFNRSGLRAS